MPYFPLIWLVLGLLRATGVIKGGGPAFGSRPGFLVVMGRMMVVAVGTSFAQGQPFVFRLIVVGCVAAVCAPGLLLEVVLVPFGFWRVAYWATIGLRPLGVGLDAKARAACYAARALSRCRDATTEQIVWIEQRLWRATNSRGAPIVAAGLLLALRGDRSGARLALSTADEMHERFLPRSLGALARDWLVADAAERGKWNEVVGYGVRRRRTLLWAYAVGRMAERIVRAEGAPHKATVLLLWAIAPRRIATFSLARRALRTPRSASQEPSFSPPSRSVPEALAQLADVAIRPWGPPYARLADAARSLESALAMPATRAYIERRALALGATSTSDGALHDFRDEVTSTLAALMTTGDDARPDSSPSSDLLDEAASKLRSKLLEDIELRCSDYERRTKDGFALAEIEEWRLWAGLVDSGRRLLALDDTAVPLLFDLTMVPICNFAVDQHNQHRRTALAHQMYSWLHRLAQGTDSPSHSLLLAKNMAAALD